jgi:5-methylcytosine-specific restriction endonuclease McrA
VALSRAEIKRRYRERHRDRVLAEHREHMRRYRAENPEKVRESKHAYYERNRETILAKSKARYEAKREEILVKAHEGAVRRRGAPGQLTRAAIRARFEFYGNKCAYCGWPEDLEVEHVIPISRGGANWPANIRPACLPCNRSKATKKLSEWSPAWTTVTFAVPQDESWRGFYDREADAA